MRDDERKNVLESLDLYSQGDLKRLVSELVSREVVSKGNDIFDHDNPIERIMTIFDQNTQEVKSVIEEVELDSIFKYGTLFKMTNEVEIAESFFAPVNKNSHDLSAPLKPTLHEIDGVYILKFTKILEGASLDSEGDPIKSIARYPMIAMFYPKSNMVEIRVNATSSILQNRENNFYYNRINDIKTEVETQYGIELEPIDLYQLVEDIEREVGQDKGSEELNSPKVSSQKMHMSSGGQATLDSGYDTEDIILPILGELKNIITDNQDLFEESDTGTKIRELLNDFIKDTEETSDLPWRSLRWYNNVKAKTLQVKFLFDHDTNRDFTMMQLYYNSRKMEGMIYVSKYLINKFEQYYGKNDPTTTS